METDVGHRKFWWAMLVVWAPWLPTMYVLARAIGGFSNSKATGLAAVAGGMAEIFVLWGIATFIIAQVVAIVWLLRTLSKKNLSRTLVSLVSVCASVATLLLIGGFFWIQFLVVRD